MYKYKYIYLWSYVYLLLCISTYVGGSVITILHGRVKQAEGNLQRYRGADPGATSQTGNHRHLAVHGGRWGCATTKHVCGPS